MRRLLSTTTVAMALAGFVGFQAHAQQGASTAAPGDQTKVKVEHGKEMTFTGCLQTGTEAKTYILDRIAPVKTTTEVVGTSGETMAVTKYELVPSEKIELQEHVGHKVEVTGVRIPAGEGDAKITTKTKLPGTEEHSETKIVKSDAPQFRVISIKQLADTCSPH